MYRLPLARKQRLKKVLLQKLTGFQREPCYIGQQESSLIMIELPGTESGTSSDKDINMFFSDTAGHKDKATYSKHSFVWIIFVFKNLVTHSVIYDYM